MFDCLIVLQLSAKDVRFVLESDGTEVDDEEYFQTIEPHTPLVILQPGEQWHGSKFT